MARERFWAASAAGGMTAAVLAASAWAQAPVPPTGAAPKVVCETGGPVRRAARHTYNVLQDNFIGYPQEFVEPPPGFYIAETYSLMNAKANPHRFTLYRSDFLDGTNRLSPNGASRFNLMAKRMGGWLGPVVIEWSPDQPGLAETRKQAVLALLSSAGTPVVPERVVIGPSPYPGLYGTDAANNHSIMITRDQAAPSSYSFTPTSGAGFGGSGGGTP